MSDCKVTFGPSWDATREYKDGESVCIIEKAETVVTAEKAKPARRSAVERAEESLAKAKAKARIKLLKLAAMKLEDALGLIRESGACDLEINGMGTVLGAIACSSVRIGEEVGE